MFDDIRGRIFLEKPAGEYLTPAFGLRCARWPFVHDQLHESAFVRTRFPWGRFFASTDTHNDFAEAYCLTRL